MRQQDALGIDIFVSAVDMEVAPAQTGELQSVGKGDARMRKCEP